MTNRAYALAAAVFVLVLAGALATGAVWLGASRTQRLTYVVVSHTAVTGLVPESQVLFKGVAAGSVGSIDFDPSNPNDILIRIDVRPGLPIRTNTYAMLRMQGVTGLAQIELDNEPGASQPLATSAQSPARIPLRPSLLDRLAATGEDTLHQLSVLLATLDQLITHDTIKHVQDVLANADQVSRETIGLIADMRQTAKAVQPVAEHMSGTLDRIDRLADDADRLSVSLRTLSTSATDLSDSGRRATDLLVTTTLPKANLAIDQFARTAVDLRQLSRTLRSDPQALLLGEERPAPGPGEAGHRP